MFCPYCANQLRVLLDDGSMRFACKTCPYKYKVKKVLKKDCPLEQKKVDDVMGDSFKNAPVTDAMCPKCGHNQAYYFEMQIRSADEPATRFYRCAASAGECGHRWRED